MNLDVVELQVKDFKKSLEFYKKLFKPLHAEENFAMFGAGKATFALLKGKKNQKTLYFRSKNLEKDHSILKKKGVKVSPIEQVHWGRKFSFTDLEGNKHFVYEEKSNV